MGRKFNIPVFYRSPVVSTIKNGRNVIDHRKRDLAPSVLDLGLVRFKIARHFGFCFGVENAIEIAYRALRENPEKHVYLLSEMIHNPHVNGDLLKRGVRFILAPDGTPLIPFESLTSEDIVIVPAFGTTVELFEQLRAIGINPTLYNATCPFVEKVWKRAAQLGERGYTVIIHGKDVHEETRATFSHAKLGAPSLVIRDLAEATELACYIANERSLDDFIERFRGRYSTGFDPHRDLQRIGVVNQTTMLAGETQAISDLLKKAIERRYLGEELEQHFADTRDTLCYATTENQDSILGLIEAGGDIAVVVGGYNSSNTSHLVELCSAKVPTYYIKDAGELISADTIRHLDLVQHQVITTNDWLPKGRERVEVLLTAGASCPDILVDEVLTRIASFFGVEERIESALKPYEAASDEAAVLVVS